MHVSEDSMWQVLCKFVLKLNGASMQGREESTHQKVHHQFLIGRWCFACTWSKPPWCWKQKVSAPLMVWNCGSSHVHGIFLYTSTETFVCWSKPIPYKKKMQLGELCSPPWQWKQKRKAAEKCVRLHMKAARIIASTRCFALSFISNKWWVIK